MDDYIERDALLADISAAVKHRGMGEIIGQTLMRYVKRQPAADVAPVVHGHRVDDGGSMPDALNATGYCLFVPTIAPTAGRRWMEAIEDAAIFQNYGDRRGNL